MLWPTKNLKNISDGDIQAGFSASLDQLFQRDIFLLQTGVRDDGSKLERGAHERSVAHKLAEYLQQQFPEWNVDCEYNRHRLEIKTINGSKCAYPDIIVHLRGIKNNILVLELKTSNEDSSEDLKKLKGFTKAGEYEYQLGVFLRLRRMQIKELTWYKAGKQASHEKSLELKVCRKYLKKQNR